MGIRIAIDRGGTFTDVCARNESHEIMFKLLSVDPANYDDAPREGVRRAIEQMTGGTIPRGELIDLSAVESIRMGTTVATNALLERKGERVAFIVTKGFKDILRIGQQARPDIFDLQVLKLDVLYEQVYEIDERVTIEEYSEDPNGSKSSQNIDLESSPNCDVVKGTSGELIRVLRKPSKADITAILKQIKASGITSLAICLLHGYTFVDHENLIEATALELGFTDISVSNKIQPMIKLVSRANSANADAYLSPITTKYIQDFAKGFKGGIEAVGDKLLFMQSDGGLTSWSSFSGLKAILSGPAGGVVGYAKTSYDESGGAILGFDMGGTSTDVSRYDGHLEHIFESTTAQITIQAPQLDINTVAAGGGSILNWKNGLFNVGPESASAHPGPACYRKGGPLTVTDANLFLGRIVVEHFPKIFGPNEDQPLDREITKTKFEQLTELINKDRASGDSKDTAKLSAEEVALGFLAVANEAMCRPIRSLTEAKGLEAERHTLASFGGAGGQHACAIAENLGIRKVIIHRYSSVLSAFGILVADVVAEAQQPESAILTAEALPYLNKRLDELEVNIIDQLKSQRFSADSIETERYLNLRYKGTETFIMTKAPDFATSFVQQHRQEFGFTLERDILVGDVRVRGVGKSHVQGDLLPNMPTSTRQAKSNLTLPVYFENGWSESALYTIDELRPGDQVEGPAMIIDKTQTIVVAPNAKATALDNHVILSIENQKIAIDEKKINPIQLSVFGHRFMSIAEQMGQTLQKTSISTNIKERLDFSCAIFDPEGGLVANAPHIPVHLGSMSSAVAFQKAYWNQVGEENPSERLRPGDVLVGNHPAYGGSHLPDITVITPVFSSADDESIMFWVASRGHHSDIGGITAGSMPPFSKEIWEEGAQIKAFKVVSKGNFDEKGLIRLLYDEPAKYPGCSGSRSLSDSISDLKAQIAANNRGIKLINALIKEFDLQVVQLYMKGFQENAEQSVRNMFKQVYQRFGSHLEAEDCMDDGTPIKLKVDISPETWDAFFDFTGTGPQVYGNLNAPKAICYSAILYVLRSIIKDDIPLNQGCLKPLKITIPDGTLISPGPEAATVGGNVETSQRITDIILKAFQVMGASQGTCNNLTFGFSEKDESTGKVKGFGYYETIAGGAGAGEGWNGQSGVQVHMTNTRSTDPEVLEKRYPCILWEFSLRKGSGGEGRYRGGEGVTRDIEFRIPMQVSILSERRAIAPFGICGGGPGQKGENIWLRGSPTSGVQREIMLGGKNTVKMSPGDHIIIKTPGGGAYGELTEDLTEAKRADTDERTTRYHPRATGSYYERTAMASAF